MCGHNNFLTKIYQQVILPGHLKKTVKKIEKNDTEGELLWIRYEILLKSMNHENEVKDKKLVAN